MSAPYAGIQITPVENGLIAVTGGDFSTIGLVVVAEDATAQDYPLNTPVLINSSDTDARTALGASGNAAQQVKLIDDQLGTSAARIVIVRVAEGVDLAATQTNLVAGLGFMEDAPALLGVTPRLLGVPGYTHQQDGGAANPIVTALQITAAKLRAMAVVTGPHSTLVEHSAWRATVAGDRLIPIETWVNIGSPTVAADSAGAVLGQFVAEDSRNAGRPSGSVANVRIQGITGPNRPIRFSFDDGSTEGQTILAAHSGIIVRGQSGDVAGAAAPGFTLLSFDTASATEDWRQYTARRVRDFLEQQLLVTTVQYVGRKLNLNNIQSVLNVMNALIRDMVARGELIAGGVTFEHSTNSAADLQSGIFRVGFKAQETSILRLLNIDSARQPEAFDVLIADILALV